MLQFLLPAALVLLGVILITIIVLRHFPQAAAIDLESLPSEQEAAMKAALMERRLKRKIMEWKNRLFPLFRRIGQALSHTGRRLHKRVSQMEQRYRQKPHTMTSEQQEDVKQKIRSLLTIAEEHLQEEHWTEAEGKYIEVLSWDHKNLDAYFGLGEVYLAKKEFAQAKETFSYLLKLIHSQESGDESISVFSSPLTTSQINQAHYDYAQCLQALEEFDEARTQIRGLIERDTNNPKYLDKAVELSILCKDRVSAQEAFHNLKKANPDNQKLASFEEQIRQLPL